MASNPIARFIQDRFIAPAIQAQMPAVQKDTNAFAYGVIPQSGSTVRDIIGQYPDTNYELLYAIYQAHADVSACVGIWAGSVTGNGWHIGLADRTTTPTPQQQKAIDGITHWLKNPNPTKRFSRILYEIAQHMAITGDAYVNKVTDSKGHIKELWGVHPATVRIIADDHGSIAGYIQRYRGAQPVHFAPEEISRLQLPSVLNDLYGHSPLESVMEEVHVDLQALRANLAIFENGIKPSAIIMLENMDEKQTTRAMDLMKQRHTQAAHHHGLMAMSGVKDVKPYSSSLKDMEFTALRALTTEKVATAFRVPKFMLNQKESADLATSAVQERQFYNGTIKPVQDIIAEVFTEEIIHAFDPELAFYFNEPDFNDSDALRADALKANAQDPRIVDVNELREKYFSLPPRENLPDVMEEETDTADAADTTTETEANQAPADSPTDQAAGTEAEATPKKQPAKKAVAKTYTQAELETIRTRREEALNGLEATVQPHMVQYFTRQEGRYIEALPAAFGASKSAVRKGIVDSLISSFVGDMSDDDRELSILLYGDLEPAAKAGVNEAQLQIGFSMDATAQQKVVTDYLLQNALAHAKGINQTTRDQLTASLTQGITDGEGIPELTARVKSVFSTASRARAQTIARTETAQAFEYANDRAMKESGVVTAQKWLTAMDERVRPTHAALEGVTVPLGQSWPGGIKPGSEINCRCTSIGVVSDNPQQ